MIQCYSGGLLFFENGVHFGPQTMKRISLKFTGTRIFLGSCLVSVFSLLNLSAAEIDCKKALFEIAELASPQDVEFRVVVESAPEYIVRQSGRENLWSQVSFDAELFSEHPIHFVPLFRELAQYVLNLAPQLDRENYERIELWKREGGGENPLFQVSQNIEMAFHLVNRVDPFVGRTLALKVLEYIPDRNSPFLTDSLFLILIRSSFFLEGPHTQIFLQFYPGNRWYAWKSLFEELRSRSGSVPNELFEFLLKDLDRSIELSEEETEETALELFRKEYSTVTPFLTSRKTSYLLWGKLERLDEAEEMAKEARRFYETRKMWREVRILTERITDFERRQRELREREKREEN